jgi:hypothetical protein
MGVRAIAAGGGHGATGAVRPAVPEDRPEGTDGATLARGIAAVPIDLAIPAVSGATEKALRSVAAMAMPAWPS